MFIYKVIAFLLISTLSNCFQIKLPNKHIREAEVYKLTANSELTQVHLRLSTIKNIALYSGKIMLLGSLALLQGHLSAKIVIKYKMILGKLSKINAAYPILSQLCFIGVLYSAQYMIVQPDLFQGPATIVNFESKLFSLRRQINRLSSVLFSVGAGRSVLGVTG